MIVSKAVDSSSAIRQTNRFYFPFTRNVSNNGQQWTYIFDCCIKQQHIICRFSSRESLDNTTFEAYLNINESKIVTHRLFRNHFNIRRPGAVSSRNKILRWESKIRTKGSVTKNKPSRRSESTYRAVPM